MKKWFHEHASMLRYMYIACLVLLLVFAVWRHMSIVLRKEQLPSEQKSADTALCTIKSVTINTVPGFKSMEDL